MIFIAHGYQHTINGDGDWDGYETSFHIRANSIEEANEKLLSKCSMHTEVDEVTEFLCPINNRVYSLKFFKPFNPIIKKWEEKKELAKIAKEKMLASLEKATIATRTTFIDREMPFLLK